MGAKVDAFIDGVPWVSLPLYLLLGLLYMMVGALIMTVFVEHGGTPKQVNNMVVFIYLGGLVWVLPMLYGAASVGKEVYYG